eukprot:TRINITY_DN5370_c0_g1_i3.p1 TRINITY_DN5370_c0_g1~~TRINITY_DN5370_c0_g1_i3.p1  ORF type:complete len:195 (-),score=41.54 TRINITY_DN5370_c0_g1_i3:135-719(-)
MATIVTYPMEVVKTRMTVNPLPGGTTKPKYLNPPHAITTIVREEGIAAFSRGMSASILGVIPFAGGIFMSYELLERAWGKPKEKMTSLEHFLNGCVAASFAQSIAYPFDTIRKKLQNQCITLSHEARGEIEFDGMVDAFRKTVSKNGIAALWRGNLANLIKVAPYAGAMFAFYELSKNLFMTNNPPQEGHVIRS